MAITPIFVLALLFQMLIVVSNARTTENTTQIMANKSETMYNGILDFLIWLSERNDSARKTVLIPDFLHCSIYKFHLTSRCEILKISLSILKTTVAPSLIKLKLSMDSLLIKENSIKTFTIGSGVPLV